MSMYEVEASGDSMLLSVVVRVIPSISLLPMWCPIFPSVGLLFVPDISGIVVAVVGVELCEIVSSVECFDCLCL
jgi:hypothetical protein